MTHAPAVSIILPTFDRLAYLREAVASVLAQTVVDWELIVVDDGSSDESVAWLGSLGEPRLTVVRQPHTGHKAQLRNRGLARARADWIAFIDSDDRWTPQKLERQLAYHVAQPAVRWSYTGRTFIDGAGDPMPMDRFKAWEPRAGRILRDVVESRANIALPSVMVERALLTEVGGFNEAFRSAEDYELWLRLAERCECGVVDEPLLEVRKHRAVTAQRPDVSVGFALMLMQLAGRSPDSELRSLAKTRGAYHAVDAADMLGAQEKWTDARSAVALALGMCPASPFAYRAAGRLAWRRVKAIVARSSAHEA
ncbi:MAG: glycosyltransferase family 2 protein [Gemmatimonadaceae bacterium]